jgi:hypothetical protein
MINRYVPPDFSITIRTGHGIARFIIFQIAVDYLPSVLGQDFAMLPRVTFPAQYFAMCHRILPGLSAGYVRGMMDL